MRSVSLFLAEIATMLTLICITGVLVSVGVLACELRDGDEAGTHYLHYFDEEAD
jgi:hypothetical protein